MINSLKRIEGEGRSSLIEYCTDITVSDWKKVNAFLRDSDSDFGCGLIDTNTDSQDSQFVVIGSLLVPHSDMGIFEQGAAVLNLACWLRGIYCDKIVVLGGKNVCVLSTALFYFGYMKNDNDRKPEMMIELHYQCYDKERNDVILVQEHSQYFVE